MSEKQAAQKARVIRKQYELEPPRGFTLRDAFRLWCNLKRGEIVSYSSEKARLEKYIMKPLGNKQLDEITAPMLIRILQPLDRAGIRSTVKRLIMRTREIFDLAVCAGYILHNPITGVSRLFRPPKTQSMASLPWQTLPEILEVIQRDASRKMQLLFLFSLCTMLRPGEVAKLRWSWIENNVITIPAEDMKKRRTHRVPLPPYSIQLLTEIKVTSKFKNSGYVFPSRKTTRHISSQALTKWLHSHPFFKDRLVAHGLRSIARSWMADQQFNFDVAEACLAHVTGNQVSRAYMRSDFLEAKWPIFTKWTEFIKSCAESAQNLVDPPKE